MSHLLKMAAAMLCLGLIHACGSGETKTITKPTNQRPDIRIDETNLKKFYTDTDLIEFKGSVIDQEDIIPNTSLEWSSDQDGILGIGQSITTTLTPNVHKITLTATDSGGLKGRASYALSILSAQNQPITNIISPAKNDTFTEGQIINFAAAVTEEVLFPNLTYTWTSDINGAFGEGKTFSFDTLKIGTHVITLDATTQFNIAANSQVINITITHPPTPTPPPIRTDITAPTNKVQPNFINDGATETLSTTFQLNLDASDEGRVAAYFIQDSLSTAPQPNPPDNQAFGWRLITPAINYTAKEFYTLTTIYPNASNVIVYVWFKDTSNNVSSGISDDIILKSADITVDASNPYNESFETDLGDWVIENNQLWEHGIPGTNIGPEQAHTGTQLVATQRNSNYLVGASGILRSPPINLPPLMPNETLLMSFAQWYDFGDLDAGHVAIATEEPIGQWLNWQSIGQYEKQKNWHQPSFDLYAFANERIRIRFQVPSTQTTAPGWYIDDISIKVVSDITISTTQPFTENFTNGIGHWWVTNGIWEIGQPSSKPEPLDGSLAGTTLSGVYPANQSTHLISPTLQLPSIDTTEILQLRFHQWYEFPSTDAGQVQISIENTPGDWGEWQSLLNVAALDQKDKSISWYATNLDLSAFVNQRVRLSFFLNNIPNALYGWYIDNLSLKPIAKINITPNNAWRDGFEAGLDHWSAENGIWRSGIPVAANAGPDRPRSGRQLAGITLHSNQNNNTLTGYTSRLISPVLQLPSLDDQTNASIGFWHWFEIGRRTDIVQVEVSISNSPGQWLEWELLEKYTGASGWKQTTISLPADQYTAKTIRIAFHLAVKKVAATSWYIDDVTIELNTP